MDRAGRAATRSAGQHLSDRMEATASDNSVLVAAQAGDEQAFVRLTAPHRQPLHRHCYRILGSLHDADDALQETMLRAWRGIDRFQPRAPLGAVALPDRDQRLPAHAGAAGARPGRRGRLAPRALPGPAPGRRRLAGCRAGGDGGGARADRARVRGRDAAAATEAARDGRAARRPRLVSPRGRRTPRRHRAGRQQRAAARPRPPPARAP